MNSNIDSQPLLTPLPALGILDNPCDDFEQISTSNKEETYNVSTMLLYYGSTWNHKMNSYSNLALLHLFATFHIRDILHMVVPIPVIDQTDFRI